MSAASTSMALLCLLLTPAAYAQPGDGPDRVSVVLLGDSITEGIMSGPPGIPYADLLAIGLANTHDFANIGCGGTSTPMWTLSQGTTACRGWNPATLFETFAIPNLPADFLTIMLGTNDSVGFFLPAVVTPGEYKDHMQEIIDDSLFYGARTIVLMSPPPKCEELNGASIPLLEDYRIAAYEICSQHPDVLCGPDVYTILDETDFEGCNLHPNQSGHAKIAQALGKELVRHTPLGPAIQVFDRFRPSDEPTGAVLLPVAIYSRGDFDAVAEIDPSTLTFGATGWEDSRLRLPALGFDGCASMDVDIDGWPDLVCLFRQVPSGLTIQSEEAWLRGRSASGAAVDAHYVESAYDLVPFPTGQIPRLFGAP